MKTSEITSQETLGKVRELTGRLYEPTTTVEERQSIIQERIRLVRGFGVISMGDWDGLFPQMVSTNSHKLVEKLKRRGIIIHYKE